MTSMTMGCILYIHYYAADYSVTFSKSTKNGYQLRIAWKRYCVWSADSEYKRMLLHAPKILLCFRPRHRACTSRKVYCRTCRYIILRSRTCACRTSTWYTKLDTTNGPIGLITFALYYYCYYNIYTRTASIIYYICLFYIFNKIQRNSTALTITF